MSPTMHPLFADFLRPFAPPLSALHTSEAQHLQADMALHADKVAGGPQSRNFDAAMRLQMTHQDATGALL